MNFIENTKEQAWCDTINENDFSLQIRLIKSDELGNVKMKITIFDDDYHCELNFKSYIGSLYNFANKLKDFDSYDVGKEIILSQQ